MAKACEQYGIHPKPGTGPGCTSAEGPTGAAGEPGVVCHCNSSNIPYESSTARLTTNDSPERTTSDSSARASTGQNTPPSHTGIGAGSDNAALPQRLATPAPPATLSSQLTAPSLQSVSADSFPWRRRTLRDLESAAATLPAEQQEVAPVAEFEDGQSQLGASEAADEEMKSLTASLSEASLSEPSELALAATAEHIQVDTSPHAAIRWPDGSSQVLRALSSSSELLRALLGVGVAVLAASEALNRCLDSFREAIDALAFDDTDSRAIFNSAADGQTATLPATTRAGRQYARRRQTTGNHEWAKRLAECIEEMFMEFGVDVSVAPVSILQFTPPVTAEVLGGVAGTLEQPWHTDSAQVGSTVGTGSELDNLSIFVALEEPNVLGVLPGSATRSAFGVLAHAERTLVVVRGDFPHCGWWTKEISRRGFAAARARGLPARQNDDVHLVFDRHTPGSADVVEQEQVLELRGLFSQAEAHGHSLPEGLGKVLQVSAGRKRRADAGLGFDEVNRLLQDGRFAEHGVNTRFAQEIARISRHLHLEHHVVVDDRYLGMGLVAGCNIKRGETITGYGGVCHGRRASVPESHLPWVLRCKDSDSVFDGFESERLPPSLWGALVNSCLGLEGISQNVDYQFERAPGAAVGRLDASEPPYVAVIRATRDIATGEQLYSAYSLRSSVVLATPQQVEVSLARVGRATRGRTQGELPFEQETVFAKDLSALAEICTNFSTGQGSALAVALCQVRSTNFGSETVSGTLGLSAAGVTSLALLLSVTFLTPRPTASPLRVTWVGCGLGLEVCYLFLYFGLTSGRAVVIDAYEESGCGMAGARTLLARALCAALGHSSETVASRTLLDAVVLTEPVRLGRVTLHLHHRDILTGPQPSAADLVWSTVTTPFHLFHFLLGAAGGAFLLTYQDSWVSFRHRAPYTVHVFRREGPSSNEKHFSLVDLTSYPSFIQPYLGLKPFESPEAVEALASHVPPRWLSLKAGLDRVLQEGALLKAGVRVATFNKEDAQWYIGYLTVFYCASGVSLAFRYDVEDLEHPDERLLSISDFGHALLVCPDAAESTVSLPAGIPSAVGRLKRSVALLGGGPVLPPVGQLYTPLLSADARRSRTEPVLHADFVIQGVCTGTHLRAAVHGSGVRLLPLDGGSLLGGDLEAGDLWASIQRRTEQGDGAEATARFHAAQVSLEVAGGRCVTLALIILATPRNVGNQGLRLFGDNAISEGLVTGFKLFVFLRSLGHLDPQSAVHTLLAYGHPVSDQTVPRRYYEASFNTEGLLLPQWGIAPSPPLAPDGAGSAVRAVIVKRVGGSRYLAVFFDTNGTVGLPGYDGGREQPQRPEVRRFELGSSRLQLTERYAASIKRRNQPAVSANRGSAVAHVFAFDVAADESFPPPELPGHLEWIPIAEAITLLAPVIPDHVGYCAAVRKAALPQPRKGSRRASGADDDDDDSDAAEGGGGDSRLTDNPGGGSDNREGGEGDAPHRPGDGGPSGGAGPPGGAARCSYCSCSNARYLLRVGHESYCNTFPTGSRVTCAVRRLELGARNRERLVVTTEVSPEPFECAWTGSQDFAQLGCIPLESPWDRTATRSFAIASYSVSAQALSAHGASVDEWSPFVIDGHVSTWIVPCGRTMLSRQAVALTSVVQAPRNPVIFTDMRHWERSFGSLIHRLSEAERETRATPYERGARISWSASLDGSPLACFTSHTLAALLGAASVIGSKLSLTLNEPVEWEAQCTVIFYQPSSGGWALTVGMWTCPPATAAQVQNHTLLQDDGVSTLDIRRSWNSTPYDRMRLAISCLANADGAASGHILDVICGLATARPPGRLRLPAGDDWSVPSLQTLNEAQVVAIRTALQQPVTLLQGPPGTGKTETVAAIVYHQVRQHKTSVLACAPANVTVDHISAKLINCGLMVLRFEAASYVSPSGRAAEMSFAHHAVRVLPPREGAEFKALNAMRQATGELLLQDAARFDELRGQAWPLVIRAVDVVCCTCSAAGDSKLVKHAFPFVIVDEAGRALEPDIVVPMTLGCQWLVLVGDHRQIGPTVTSRSLVHSGLGVSLFERLTMAGVVPLMLEVQYRMHPELSAYPSVAFYDGRLRDGVTAQQRVSELTLKQPWNSPLAFLHSATPEFRTASSSFSNAGEADVVLKLLGILLEGGVSGGDVAVITPYDAQRQHLRGKISARYGAIGVDVDSVDAFQGRESNFVIISMVRSNSQRRVGFFDKDTRLNVAITRARYCLVIIGNHETLCSAPNLSAYLANLASRRLIYTMDSSMKLEHMAVAVHAAGLVTRDEFGALLGSLEMPSSSTKEASASGDSVVSAAAAEPGCVLECPGPLVDSRRACERPVAAVASDFCPVCANELQALCTLRAPCASSYCDCGYRTSGCSACAHLVVPRALEPEALEPEALALSADSVTLPRRLPAGRQRGYGLFRRFVWRWFARVIGYMDSSETLRYWRYARLQLAAESQALRRSCRYDVRPHPSRPLGLSPSGKLRMCPLIRGAFFRAIRRCVCEYGGLAALRLTATKVDWDRGKIEVQLTLEYWLRYVVALRWLTRARCSWRRTATQADMRWVHNGQGCRSSS